MENKKIILCKGLPGSGKSFWAKQYCIDNPDFKRVNKDDIREKHGNLPWAARLEKNYLQEERFNGCLYLSQGFNLIIDDTNFSPVHEEYWREIANSSACDFEIKEFKTDLKTCLERNSLRAKPVPEVAIRSMYDKYVRNELKYDNRFILKQDENLKRCIISDFDGTISLMNGRVAFDYASVNTDLPNQNVINVLNNLSVFNKIIIVTGREESCRDLCIAWLDKYNVKYDELFMRKTKDFRSDDIIKKEIYEAEINGKYYVTAVYDDRDKVVKLWRSIGLFCCQVYYGDF